MVLLDTDDLEEVLDAIVEKLQPYPGVGWRRKQDEGGLWVYELRVFRKNSE